MDQDAQFHSINERVKKPHTWNHPAISIETKKKELLGDLENAGRE